MSKLNLTTEEEQKVLEFLERYLPELRHEIANTDDRELKKFLKDREAFMNDLMGRLNA